MVFYYQEEDMNNFWNNENEAVSEYDLLEEAQEVEDIAEEYANQPVVVEASEEELEQVAEESAYELDQEESNIVYNAKLRLEQARLYDLLINHNLFEGVEADANAIAIVQNELKHYIVRRLEILLGIRQPQPKKVKEETSFNDVEVDFLKQLAYKGTLGRTSSNTVQAQPKPVSTQPRQQGLKPIGQKAISKPRPKKKQQARSSQQAPQPSQKTKPKKNNVEPQVSMPKLKPSGLKRQLTMEEATAIAKADLEATKNKKPWDKMNKAEKEAEIRRVNQKYTKKRPTNAQPFPTADQLQMQYMTQMQQRSASNTNQVAQFNEILANALANQKNNS